MNSPDLNYGSGRKCSKQRVKQVKRFKLKYFFRWLRKDPLKFIAYISAVILVYITILFIKYANEQDKNNEASHVNTESNKSSNE